MSEKKGDGERRLKHALQWALNSEDFNHLQGSWLASLTSFFKSKPFVAVEALPEKHNG